MDPKALSDCLNHVTRMIMETVVTLRYKNLLSFKTVFYLVAIVTKRTLV